MSLILETIQNHEPSCLALVGDTQSYTYGDLKEEIVRRVDAMSGVSVLGLTLDNGPDWVLWDLAAVQAEIPCVPLPPFFTPDQISYTVQVAGISHIVYSEGVVATDATFTENTLEGTAKITFTSGTTGTPKGVCLSQNGLEQVAQSLVEVLGSRLADKHLSVLPLAVLLENVAGVYATLLAGGTVYVPSLKTIGFSKLFQPEFSALSGYMMEHDITSAILVPELLRGLMASNPHLPSLNFLAVGGAKVSPALISAARKSGLPVYEGYGLSECASVIALNTPDHDQPGSVGMVLPHIQLSENNGEIVIQDPAFLGYLGHEHKGVFDTGDLGRVDESGFLHIDGRKKNILITSYGRNVSPEWVRDVLLAQPEIQSVEIYGDGQPNLSANVVPISPCADVAQAIARANTELPEYAQIKNFQIITKENDHGILRTVS